LQGEPLVLNGLVSVCLSLDVKETKGTETEVHGDEDHVVAGGQVRAIVEADTVTITKDVGATVHPKHNWKGAGDPLLHGGVHIDLPGRKKG